MIDRYNPEEMKKIWSKENKYRTWLEIEIAVCQARFEEGKIPSEDFKLIKDKADFNINRIEEIEEEVHHDVIAFLSSVAEKVGKASRHIHFGMTSSDVLDTSTALLLIEASLIIKKELEDLLIILKEKSIKFKYDKIMGRTHGVHAELTTVGLKFLSYYENINRSYKRLLNGISEISFGKISGPVGVYGNINTNEEKKALNILGLKVEPVATQIVPRDRHLFLIMSYADIATALERIALQIRLLQRTETNEMTEPFSKKQKGSSAMPHKKNPIICERICGLSRLFRGYVIEAMDNVSLWDERDISHSSVERILFPEITGILLYIIRKMKYVVKDINVNFDSINNNILLSKERYISGPLLLALCDKGYDRDEAYLKIQSLAHSALINKKSFYETVIDNNELKNILGKELIENIAKNEKLKDNINIIFERVLK